MIASRTHLVVIPSYNTGATVYATVRAARAVWSPVWVVVDGSDDGTAEGLRALAAGDEGLRIDVLPTRARLVCRFVHSALDPLGIDRAAAGPRRTDIAGA